MPPLFAASCLIFQLVVAPGIAMIRGGAPERILAAQYWIGSILSALILFGHQDRYSRPELGVAAVDLISLVIMIVVAVRANRWWPIWFTACHGMALLAHVGRMMNPHIHYQPYMVMAAYVAYPLWGMIIVGTIGHEMRIRRYGSDPSWKHSSPTSIPIGPVFGQTRR